MKLKLLIIATLLLTSCRPSDISLAKHVISSSYKIGVIVNIDGKVGEICGSGTAISKHEILTCRHLFMFGHKKIFVQDVNGKTYSARIEKISKSHDLALLEVEDSNLDHLGISKHDPKRGEAIYSLGYPLAGPLEFCKGIITGFMDGYLLSDVLILNGSSGGALINERGQVCGITVMSTSHNVGSVGLSISESVKNIKEFLK